MGYPKVSPSSRGRAANMSPEKASNGRPRQAKQPGTGIPTDRLSPAPKEIAPFLSYATIKDPAFLDFVRSRPCIICFREDRSEPHHVFKMFAGISYGGIGSKGSDFLALPVCRECHTRFHGDRFELERERILELIIVNLVCFLAENKNAWLCPIRAPR